MPARVASALGYDSRQAFLEAYGTPVESFGNSTGTLDEILL